MTDDDVRALYAAALARRGTPNRDGCPPPEALLALVERTGGEPTRLATLDHVMGCGAGCGSELELLRSLHLAGRARVGGDAAEADTRMPARWRRAWVMPAAAAAVLLVAVGVGRHVRGRDDAESRVTRGGVPSLELVSPADGATAVDAPRFVWRALPGVRRYLIEVLAPGTDVVQSFSTADTAFLWRPTTRRNGEYRWWVRATDADGVEHDAPARRLVLRGRE